YAFQYEVDLVQGDEVTFSGSLARLPIDPTAPVPEEHVGHYALGLGTLESDNPNYAIADFVGASFEIRRRPIKIEVIDKEQTKVYGTEHSFGGQGVGWRVADDSPYDLLPGDTLTGGLVSAGASRAAAVLRNVNKEVIGYEIEHTLHNPNYDIEFVGGTLTVLPAVALNNARLIALSLRTQLTELITLRAQWGLPLDAHGDGPTFYFRVEATF